MQKLRQSFVEEAVTEEETTYATHTESIRVIYGDTDQMGVVYYANYFRYFESGRNELLRTLGFEYKEMEERGFMLPVARASAKYRAPARYDDLLALETRLVEFKRSSLRIVYRLTRGHVLIATGETVHALIDGEGNMRRIPDEWRARLTANSRASE